MIHEAQRAVAKIMARRACPHTTVVGMARWCGGMVAASEKQLQYERWKRENRSTNRKTAAKNGKWTRNGKRNDGTVRPPYLGESRTSFRSHRECMEVSYEYANEFGKQSRKNPRYIIPKITINRELFSRAIDINIGPRTIFAARHNNGARTFIAQRHAPLKWRELVNAKQRTSFIKKLLPATE